MRCAFAARHAVPLSASPESAWNPNPGGLTPFAPNNDDIDALMLVAVVKRTRMRKERR
jgi:hypothetical protein